MRNGKDKQVATIVGQGVRFEGALISKTAIRIEGTVKGRVECESLLIISTTAKVEAEVLCDDVYVAGEVWGNITVKNLVEVTQKGRVIGNITAAYLVMEQGAIFEGKCNMNRQSDQHSVSMHLSVTDPRASAEAGSTAH